MLKMSMVQIRSIQEVPLVGFPAASAISSSWTAVVMTMSAIVTGIRSMLLMMVVTMSMTFWEMKSKTYESDQSHCRTEEGVASGYLPEDVA
jgi:hypothetical protein